MIYEDPKYAVGNYAPVRTSDPDAKTYNYYLRNVSSIYSIFYRGGASTTFSTVATYAELRAFANGTQNEDFYKSYLSNVNRYSMGDDFLMDNQLGVIGKRKKAKGFMKPLWQILSPAPKIVNSMVGTLTKTQTDIVADPIDNKSKSLTEDAKIEAWATAQNLDILKQAHEMAGLEMEMPDFVPESQDELQLYEDLGGFKPAFSRVMEKLIMHTMDISDYQELENKMYRDAIALGVVGVKEYYDPQDGKYKVRTVDPARSGVQWSEFADCRTSEWAYEFRYETISTLQQYFPEKSFEDFQALAYTFCSYMGNPSRSDWNTYRDRDHNGFMKFDFFKVPVMDAVWIDDEDEKYVEQKGKYRDRIYPVNYNEKVNQKEGKTEKFIRKRYCYGATWIVGTTDIYNWGKLNDQYMGARIPYHFYVFPGKSIVQQLIPLFHNFQVLWLKYLNALALSVNSGYWINSDMLANIAAGGDTGSGEDDKQVALRRFLDTGIGFYSRINAAGVQNLQDMPVNEFRGGMGQIFIDIMTAFQFNTTMIESITGVNPILMGATPNQNAPVTTTQMSVEAVAAIMKPLLDGYLSVKLNMARNLCRLIHICVHAYPFSRKQYERVVGEMDMQVLLAADRDSTEYAIRLDTRPGEGEKQQMIISIQNESGVDKDGNSGGLTGMDAIILIRRIEAGIPLAQVLLELETRRRKNQREAQQAASQNIQQQAQMNAQNAQMASELKIREAEALHAFKMAEIQEQNKGLLANTQLQEGMRHQKESEVQQLKSEAERYTADIKANTQLTDATIKANVQRETAAQKTTGSNEK